MAIMVVNDGGRRWKANDLVYEVTRGLLFLSRCDRLVIEEKKPCAVCSSFDIHIGIGIKMSAVLLSMRGLIG